jgi:two-component system cell cycle sensor histidine kinase/response regulator CckA
MTDKIDLDEKGNVRSCLWDSAEEKLGESLGLPSELKNKSPEEIIHELHVHQIELEMQNEELKRLQIESEESKNKYQDLYDFAPVGYFTLSHKGIIHEVNLKGAALLGMPRSQLIGRGFARFVAPESETQWYQHIIAVFGKQGKHTCDLNLKREDGSLLYAGIESVRIDASAGPEGVNGRTHVASMTVSDITNRKAAEEAVQRSEKFLEQIVENIPNMIFVKDAENLSFLRFNKAGEELLGSSRKDLLGKNDYDFFPANQADSFVAKDRAVLTEGKLVDIPEEEILTKHKGERILHTKKIPILDANGTSKFLLGISEDITERKQSEETNLRIAAIVESSEDAIIGKTLDDTVDSNWNFFLHSRKRAFSRSFLYEESHLYFYLPLKPVSW